MTQAEFNEMFKTAMNAYMESLARQEPDDWSEEDRKWCYDSGIITGGKYKAYPTREELAAVVHRTADVIAKVNVQDPDKASGKAESK